MAWGPAMGKRAASTFACCAKAALSSAGNTIAALYLSGKMTKEQADTLIEQAKTIVRAAKTIHFG